MFYFQHIRLWGIIVKAKNKWNGNVYKVVSVDEKTVTLERENGKKFTIAKSEFYFTYIMEKSE